MVGRVLGILTLGGLGAACGLEEELWRKTWRWAQAWGLDPYLVAAVVWVESRYCPEARGKAGELGLGQFLASTWQRTTGAPPGWRRDPDWALWATAKHLRELYLATGGDWQKALAAYNAGLKRVREGRIPPSTRAYVRQVLEVYGRWRGR